MAPIVLQVVRALDRNPLPYLVAVATASNCGSVATITGNPQNMVIGTLSRIPYPAFAAALAPVAAFGLVAVVVVVRLVYAQEFAFKGELEPHLFRGHMHTGQVVKASFVCVALAIAFFAGVPPAKAAILGGAFLLLTRQIKPRRIYRELDGPLLILFAGMFVVVAGAEKALLTPDRIAMAKTLGLDMVWRLSLFTAVLSNIVSNVPAVLALRPFIPTFPDPQRAWLVVAMSSTLAGNFTLLGSVANLIVAEHARSEGMPISFWAYFKVGAPLTRHHARRGDGLARLAVELPSLLPYRQLDLRRGNRHDLVPVSYRAGEIRRPVQKKHLRKQEGLMARGTLKPKSAKVGDDAQDETHEIHKDEKSRATNHRSEVAAEAKIHGQSSARGRFCGRTSQLREIPRFGYRSGDRRHGAGSCDPLRSAIRAERSVDAALSRSRLSNDLCAQGLVQD